MKIQSMVKQFNSPEQLKERSINGNLCNKVSRIDFHEMLERIGRHRTETILFHLES